MIKLNTCSTSTTPGTSSNKARSMPAFNVIVELGQVPQALIGVI